MSTKVIHYTLLGFLQMFLIAVGIVLSVATSGSIWCFVLMAATIVLMCASVYTLIKLDSLPIEENK